MCGWPSAGTGGGGGGLCACSARQAGVRSCCTLGRCRMTSGSCCSLSSPSACFSPAAPPSARARRCRGGSWAARAAACWAQGAPGSASAACGGACWWVQAALAPPHAPGGQRRCTPHLTPASGGSPGRQQATQPSWAAVLLGSGGKPTAPARTPAAWPAPPGRAAPAPPAPGPGGRAPPPSHRARPLAGRPGRSVRPGRLGERCPPAGRPSPGRRPARLACPRLACPALRPAGAAGGVGRSGRSAHGRVAG
jgi:hypothetical protein